MWCQRCSPASLLRNGCRGVVNTKIHRRRKEWLSKTYPRASTEEPSQLPRRGRHGGWMKDPHLSVARLDGTNSAQQAWWANHAGEVDGEYAARMQAAFSAGDGAGLQEALDGHLADMDALRVRMPSAEDFRRPHVKALAETAKPNPVHELFGAGPPLAEPPEPEQPAFVGPSLEQRRRSRGRFLGSPRREDDDVPLEREAKAQGGGRTARWLQEDSDESSESEDEAERPRGRRSAQLRRERGEGAATASRRAPPEPMEPLRHTSLSGLWSSRGASWVEFNRCVVPSAFPVPEASEHLEGATMSAYEQARNASVLIDVSYKVGLRVTGADREFVADQFLTCNLRAMRTGDVQYACILDSKGLVLDDAFVYLTADSVEILTSGCYSLQLTNYLGQYVVYVRRSGADVALEPSPLSAAVALQGPRSRQALVQALERLEHGPSPLRLSLVDEEGVVLRPSVLESMPYMSCLRLVEEGGDSGGSSAVVLCAGSTGEDGFEILAPPGGPLERLAAALLDLDPLVRPAGAYCLDILRMEAGLPRVGADIPSGIITPIKASLAWTLDQSKMRHHLMFGWQRLFFQLAKGPKLRRVGLLLDGPAHAGCRLLSNPHRQPIGTVASTAWSPALERRVAMAYVRPEYAKANKHVLINVPYNLPTHKMRKKAIKGYNSGLVHSKALRSSYRRLVAGCVVRLPFVGHRYPEPQRQRMAAARMRHFTPEAPAAPQPARPARAAAAAKRREPAPESSLGPTASDLRAL